MIGSGILGSLVALELASKGIDVELLERNPSVMGEASLHNEGKIHLGFIYAKDTSLETARGMVGGALRFREIVWRLTGFRTETALSTPFFYAVHRNSLIPPVAFQRHIGRTLGLIEETIRKTGGRYVDGSTSQQVRQVPRSQWADDLDSDEFLEVFETSELSVDPRAVAEAVRQAVERESRIHLRLNSTVEEVSVVDSAVELRISEFKTSRSACYRAVVNASWSDLIRLDRSAGLASPSSWSYRFKLATRSDIQADLQELRSLTVVLGPFGDIVNFGPRGVFVSWYPTGRLMFSTDEVVEDWNADRFRPLRDEAFSKSVTTWNLLSQHFKDIGVTLDNSAPMGGIILADGLDDVDVQSSGLHYRSGKALRQKGQYFSVNTGKYTVAPSLAVRVAQRVTSIL